MRIVKLGRIRGGLVVRRGVLPGTAPTGAGVAIPRCTFPITARRRLWTSRPAFARKKARRAQPDGAARARTGTTEMCRADIGRRAAVCLLGVLVILAAAPAMAEGTGEARWIALVVGNSGYEHVPRLANPGNDARLIATTLRQLGFTLVGNAVQENVDKPRFDKLVQDFGRAIQGAEVALFYYAGHGMQVDGTNWLVPTDANPTRPQDLAFQMVNADLVLQQMDGAGTRLNLVMLDACRNNPFAELGTRAVKGGLAEMRAPEGTMISFATQPGNAAVDGSGADGPYAMALAAAMRQPGLDIFRVFNTVGLSVKRATNGEQLPWVSSSPIDGEFYFNANDAVPDVVAAMETDAAPADQQGASRDASPTNGAAASSTGAASPGKPAASNTATIADQGTLDTLRSQAEQGDAKAQTDLGIALAKGVAVPRDDAAARHWFALAAAQGAAKAQYWMGALLERGRGGPRSYAEALGFYQHAADQGYPPAEVAMGRFYGRGLGVARDKTQRTDWFRRAAEHNNPAGQLALGNFYQFGDGVEKNMALARQWYERAANQNFVPAAVRLGLLYEHGNGVPQNYAEAFRWFHLAADAGNAAALNDLGVFYRRGLGVARDYTIAMRLFRQAADKGNAMAAFNIGLLYANGHGVKADRLQAREWFEKAAAAGNQPAIDRLARIDGDCGAGKTPGSEPGAPGGQAAAPENGKC